MIKALLIALMALLCVSAQGQQPEPHGIAGYVFNRVGSAQVQSGTPFIVNNTVSLDYYIGVTGIAIFPGRYSVVIEGNNGDGIKVWAWNATHYGNRTFALSGDMDNQDLNLSQTRQSETNISFHLPDNSSRFNLGDRVNFTANLTIIGGSAGTGCIATLNFTPESGVFGLNASRQVSIGGIPLGARVQVNWSMLANATGSVNATAIASCGSDFLNFDGLNADRRFNLSARDLSAPLVSLLFPLNNTLNATHHNITFFYNVSDNGAVGSCSLIINDALNASVVSPVQNTRLNFSAYLGGGQFNWTVNCTDDVSNVGSSGEFNLTVDVPPIRVANVLASDPLLLIAGSTQLAWCNATITPPGTRFNATLVQSGALIGPADDNSTRYTNASCADSSGNISCSFNVLYHANNGTWRCNMTAINYEGVVNSSNASVGIPALAAIDILPDLIEYGGVPAGNFSALIPVNVSNAGNVPLNLELYAYGALVNDSLALNCTSGNLTADLQKVSVNQSMVFEGMTDVSPSSSAPTAMALGLAKRTTSQPFNTTYWRLSVPRGGERNCSGYVVFTALIS